jgi:GrpB-like predicted nucleotidyltransferase (UPF0157 family)
VQRLWKFELRDYDPIWPIRYRAEVSELMKILPMVLAFEHVGSTSIQGRLPYPRSTHWQACTT